MSDGNWNNKISLYKLILLANSIFFLHVLIVMLIIFGWLLPIPFYWVYIVCLISIFLLDITVRYCPLTKWEFYVRKKLNQNLDYNYSFISYYGYVALNLLGYKPSKKLNSFLYYFELLFVIVSLMIAIYHISYII